MKSNLMAVLLAGSSFLAGSAYAADYKVTYQGGGYAYVQFGQLQAWDSPPDMDPNFVGLVVPLGRIFGTWVARNHRTVWGGIAGVFSYVTDLGDGTVTGNPQPDYKEVRVENPGEVCSVYDEFNSAGENEQASEVNGNYGAEYDASKEEMDFLDGFCASIP